MKIKIINGVTGGLFHETEDILEASTAISWLLPAPEFIMEEEIYIVVSVKQSMEDDE